MVSPLAEEHFEELFRLLEEQKIWARRRGTLSKLEMTQFHDCLTRIDQLLQQLLPDGDGGS